MTSRLTSFNIFCLHLDLLSKSARVVPIRKPPKLSAVQEKYITLGELWFSAAVYRLLGPEGDEYGMVLFATSNTS